MLRQSEGLFYFIQILVVADNGCIVGNDYE